MQSRNHPELFAEELLKRSDSIEVPGGRDYLLDAHQSEAMLEAAVSVSDNMRRFSVVHPGGSGKTVLEAGIIQASQAAKARMGEAGQQMKDLVLTVERSLVVGVRDHIETALGHEVGIWGMGERDLDHNVIVATIQSLQHNRSRLRDLIDPEAFSLVIGDEADKYLTRSRMGIVNRFSNAFRVGLTATEQWPDLRHTSLLWGDIVHQLRLSEGIRRGINVPPLFYMYESELDGDDISISGDDYEPKHLAAAMKRVEIEKAIPEIYRQLVPSNRRQDFPTLFYVPGLSVLNDTTETLQREFAGDGLNITNWHGDTPSETIMSDIVDFERGRINMLVLCEMGGRGLNLPRARCLIDAYPTLSPNKLEQRHSRVLRQIRPGTRLAREGFQKDFALVAQVVPQTNAFRPITLLDILEEYEAYIGPTGGGGGGGGRGGDDPINEIVQQIKAQQPRHGVRLVDYVDVRRYLRERGLFSDLPTRDDEDGFAYR